MRLPLLDRFTQQRRRRRREWLRATPPALRDGYTIGPPDFVGVGAQRCGTSWWYSLIAQHPAVTAPPDRAKELHFFDRLAGEAEPLAGDYHRFFPREPGAIAGEWTPSYMYRDDALPLLHAAAPGAKVLVMLRDPVERYPSGRALWLRREPRALEDAHADALARGFYATQLERLFEVYEPDCVLVLQYEACTRDPHAAIARTYEFLDIDAGFRPDVTRRAGGLRYEPLDAQARGDLVRAYRQDVARLEELVPDFDVTLWPNFRQLAG